MAYSPTGNWDVPVPVWRIRRSFKTSHHTPYLPKLSPRHALRGIYVSHFHAPTADSISHPLLRCRPMCLTVSAGDTLFLNCGHVSNLHVYEEDCGSSHCLTSQNHSNGVCPHGQNFNCQTCLQIDGACDRHHTCRVYSGHQTRHKHTSVKLCWNCR